MRDSFDLGQLAKAMCTHVHGPALCQSCSVAIRPLLGTLADARAEAERLRGERDEAYGILCDAVHGTPATLREAAQRAAKTIRDHDAERGRIVGRHRDEQAGEQQGDGENGGGQ